MSFPADSTVYHSDLRVARLTVLSALSVPGGGDGGAVDSLVNAGSAEDGAGVFRSTAGGVAALRRLVAETDSLTVTEGADVVTFALARAVIGASASAAPTSVALGPEASASGSYAAALGPEASASGPNAVALGYRATANVGAYASALGCEANASGVYSAAQGYGAAATGGNSLAVGSETLASEDFAAAFGSGASASGSYAVALGPAAGAAADCSTAVGAGAQARVAGTVNLGGIPIARRAGDTPVVGHTRTSIQAAPLVALTTLSWAAADADGDNVAQLAIPDGAVFFPESLRVWCDSAFGSPSDGVAISVGTTEGGGDVIDAMPVGLVDRLWASRVGAIPATGGVTGTLYFTQGGSGGYTLRCSVQGLLIEMGPPPSG